MPANQNHLLPGEALGPGQVLTSSTSRFTFTYQGDGNLVLYKNYRNQPRKPLWASDTAGSSAGSCDMQGDGNLVIYDAARNPVWASNTDGHPGSRLVLQDDGNAVIYDPADDALWDTGTFGQVFAPTGPVAQGDEMQPGEVLNPNQFIRSYRDNVNFWGQCDFIYQGDGNLVLYRGHHGCPLWASNTAGQSAEVCIMQGDGNLVIYDGDGNPLWASDTPGNPGSRLVVQDDANVVIYRPDQTVVWATNTVGWFPTSPPFMHAVGHEMRYAHLLYPDEYLSSANGQYRFVYQGDGNLVLYRNQDAVALWASGTYEVPAGACWLAGNNLVLSRCGGAIYWVSDPNGTKGVDRLVVQDDGNVVIYNAGGTALWATNTVQ